MWVIVASLVLLGCLIFIAITILGYTGHASSMNLQLDDLQHTIDHKNKRLEDYRLRAEELQDGVPDLNKRVEYLKQWIAMLKKQKMQLSNKQGADKTAGQRDAAIRKNLTTGQKRK